MVEYVMRHWRGNFPLGQAYWINGVLLLLPFGIGFELASAYLAAHHPISLLAFLAVVVLPFAVMLAAAAWSGVGIWRSAGRRIAFRHFGWAWASRIAVLTGAALLALTALGLGWEASLLARGGAPITTTAAGYDLDLHGNTAVFRGEIGDAAADDLELMLKDPTVKRLAIAGSAGGAIAPALRIAKMIHDRKLFVVALAECDAACTVLLAAGQVRAIVPATVMGFHVDGSAPWLEAQRYYAAAGLRAPFLFKLRAHTADAYEPPLSELIAAGFITQIFIDARGQYVPAKAWCAHTKAACACTGRQNLQTSGT